MILALVAALVTSGCATVNVPNIGEAGYQEADDERRLEKRADEFTEIIDDSGYIYQDRALEEYINAVANKLLPASVKEEGKNVVVKVLADPALNAFAVPNGKIYIHTGMLAAIENEAQLAALLAHEMVHVTHLHSLKQFRSLINKSAFFSTMAAPMAVAGGELGILLAQITMVSSVYGYSRELEHEADTVGFQMLIDAGYDVSEAPKLFEKLEEYIEDEEIKQPFFFSTHPGVRSRIKNFQDLVAENPTEDRGDRTVNQSGYDQTTLTLKKDNVLLCFHEGMFKTAERNINRFIEKNPDAAPGHYYLGELFRQRQDTEKRKKKREKEQDYIKAITAYDKAIALSASYADSYKGKGRVLRSQGKIKEAKEAFQKYLELNPEAGDRAYIEQFLSRE